MRKMFLLFGMLAMVGVLFVACTDEQATAPVETPEEVAEPDFSFQWPQCEQVFYSIRPEGKARALFRVFDGQIIAVSLVRQVRRNAYYGNHERAMKKAWRLANLVNKKLPNRLVDPCGSAAPTTVEGAAALVNEVFALAGDPGSTLPPPEIPPAAFLPEGGYGVVTPGVPDTIWTNNDEAAFVANSSSFSGAAGPVTIVLTRLADPPGTPGVPIPEYQAYPEAYDISANAELDGEAEFWMCVLDDALPYPEKFDELVIGHLRGDGESELLTPRLVETFPGEVVDCGTAGTWAGPPDPPGDLVIMQLPGWLQFTGRVLEPLAERLLDVDRLDAMYFAGKGLGGRGGALSPFAPVDPGGGTVMYSLSCAVSGGNGEVSFDDGLTCSADSYVEVDTGITILQGDGGAVQFPSGTQVEVTTTPGQGFELVQIDGCDGGNDDPCIVTMDGNKSATATFDLVDTSYTLTLGWKGVNREGTIHLYTDPDGTPDASCLVGDDVAPCVYNISSGEKVKLTAETPATPILFDGWDLDCEPASGTDCWLWMIDERAANAGFVEPT